MNAPRFSRLVVTLFVLVVSFFPVINTNAAPVSEPIDPPALSFAAASLKEVDGDGDFVLVPLLVSAVQDGENYYLTYEVGIPADLLNGELTNNSGWELSDLFLTNAKADSDSHVGCDSTASVCATVVLYYTTLIGDHGWYQKTTTRWTRSDPAVIWSAARQGAKCFAEWYPGPGLCDQQQFKTIGVPTSGITYTLTPTFSGSSNQIYIGGRGAISGDQRITFKRGSSTWTFAFCVGYGLGDFAQCY